MRKMSIIINKEIVHRKSFLNFHFYIFINILIIKEQNLLIMYQLIETMKLTLALTCL